MKRVISIIGVTVVIITLLPSFSLDRESAFANGDGHTHFRYGHYTWSPVSGTTIEFTIQNAWRRNGYGCINPATFSSVPCSAQDGLPGIGDVIVEFIGGTQFFPGDGSGPLGSPLGPLLYLVTSIDPTNNWLFGLALDPASLPAIDTTISHTYPGPGNFTAFTDSCCRISRVAGINEHINNPDGGYRVETVVNVDTTNSPPVSTLPPIVLCPIDALCSFLVPGADSDGDPLSFRLSTSAEASSFGVFTQPGPPHAPNAASIDSTTGLYTWDTTEATLASNPANNTLYSTQVTIEDPTSKVAVDFLIQLVEEDVNPPIIEPPSDEPPICETTQVLTVGITKTFDVIAHDPDSDDIVTLNVVGLPVGATMSPSLPIAGNPVTSSFSWTPNAGQVGVHVVTFTASSSGGGFALCPVTLEVTMFRSLIEYFALGDSIASGHGLLDDGSECSRSFIDAYPWKVFDELTARYGNVHFPPTQFLACSGAEANLDINKVEKDRHKWLGYQVDDALARIRELPPNRPVLVTISIGMNDTGWADPAIVTQLRKNPENFQKWIDGISEKVATALKIELRLLLLQHPNVVVVINTYHNPFNRNSHYFFIARRNPGGLLTSCDDLWGTFECYDRTERAVHTLNNALILDVFAPIDDMFPGRIRVADVHDSFHGRESPKFVCGTADPSISETWIQYPGDPESNATVWRMLQDIVGIKTGDPCIHPNKKGAQEYAEAVFNAAVPLLDSLLLTNP